MLMSVTTVEAESGYTGALQKCLTAIHESSRIATEIVTLEAKLTSLNSIRNTFTGDAAALAKLDPLNGSIEGTEANLSNKKNELKEQESNAINGFITVMRDISKGTEIKSDTLLESVNHSLEEFQASISKQFESELVVVRRSIETLKKEKANKNETDKQLEDLKAQIMAAQADAISRVMEGSTTFFKSMTVKLETIQKELNLAVVSQQIHDKVNERVDQKMKQEFEVVKKAAEKAAQSNLRTSEQIDDTVREQLDKQLPPSIIQNIIKLLPEFELLQKVGEYQLEAAKPAAESKINYESLKQSVLSLSSQLTELKQYAETSKSQIDSIRSQNTALITTGNNNVEPSFDTNAAIKRMESIEREVTLLHANVKMMDTAMAVRVLEFGDETSQPGTKRARNETSQAVTVHDSSESSDLMARIELAETKHQKLLDFIVQCKDDVLHELFAERLNKAMNKIEQVLSNHEKFIAFLIDPFTTTKTLQNATINTESAVPEDTLSPAMIDAISQLVKQTAEKVALPLEKKIKLLEDKLSARST